MDWCVYAWMYGNRLEQVCFVHVSVARSSVGRCIQDRRYGLYVRCCAGCSIRPSVRPRRARAACIHLQKCASRFVRLIPRIIKLHSIFTLYSEWLRRFFFFFFLQRWYDLLTVHRYSPCPRALARSGSVRDTESTGGKSLEEDSSSRREEKGKGTTCIWSDEWSRITAL